MAVEVYKNLFVGNLTDCNNCKQNDFAIIHACKTPCHQQAVGYTKSLSSTHPNYLIKEEVKNLYLNLVDMDNILPKYTNEPIKQALNFVEKHLSQNNKVLIHCNQGQSRSCAIAIIYLAKNKIISSETFEKALTDFKKLYLNVNLGTGFYNYLQNYWLNLMN